MQVEKQTLSEQIKAAKTALADLQAKVISFVYPLKDKTKLTVKIGDKGTINVYGLGKNPVCLYFSQIVRYNELLNSPEFRAFIKENADKIAMKKAE